jgi:hypothetical protein
MAVEMIIIMIQSVAGTIQGLKVMGREGMGIHEETQAVMAIQVETEADMVVLVEVVVEDTEVIDLKVEVEVDRGEDLLLGVVMCREAEEIRRTNRCIEI